MGAPDKIGKYQIRRELGRGAMGVVYEGFDPHIERRVALKTLRRELLDAPEVAEFVERFQREARAAGRLSHPNIVGVYDFGQDADVAYIAMEFISGRSLKEAFDENTRFALPEAVRIMTQLLEALEAAHRQGVVHRDIKPANVMLLADGTVKVTDFGIARLDASTLTATGSVLGSPAYMSPEQVTGMPVDGRSDLFSAGVILYQMLTGEKPFQGSSASTVMHKVLKEEPTAPSELNVTLPAALDAVVRKALAKRPDERFQSGGEFARALRSAQEGAGTSAGIATLATDATVLAGAESTLAAPRASDATLAAPRSSGAGETAASRASPEPASPAPRPTARNRTAVVAGSAAAVVVAVAIALLLLKDAPAPEQGAASSAPARAAQPPSETSPAQAPSAPPPAPAPVAAARSESEPGTLVITAVGLADPKGEKYKADRGLLVADARQDARRQLVEKALALYLDPRSLAQHYAVLQDRFLRQSDQFVKAVVREDAPWVGKDGLMHAVTRATVKVKEVQRSLNRMSKEERIAFIRTHGDPRIAVSIGLRDADRAGEDEPSQLAENMLKERIRAFGFRTWTDDGSGKQPDFSIVGEAKFRKLSHRLEASGLVIEKVVLTSWTVKCIDRASGEEIYYNTKMPEKASWANKDAALRDIGQSIGEEFSKDFFLQHFSASSQPVTLRLENSPAGDFPKLLLDEILALRPVLSAILSPSGGAPEYRIELAGAEGGATDILSRAVLEPINAKLGRSCLTLKQASGNEAIAAFAPDCADPAVLGRLESLPPAALIAAPPERQQSIGSPETLRKLVI